MDCPGFIFVAVKTLFSYHRVFCESVCPISHALQIFGAGQTMTEQTTSFLAKW